MSISARGSVSGVKFSGLLLKSMIMAGLVCLITAFAVAVVLLAAPPVFAQQGAVSAAANPAASIGPADGEQNEWRAGGTVMASLKFGSRAGEIGCADPAAALYGFISPTSLFYKNGALFVLDAPNFRINKYVAQGPGKPFIMDKTIVLYEKPSSSSSSSSSTPAAAVESGAVPPPLFTDLSVLDNGAIFVASSREKLIYHYDASGVLVSKISPKVKLDGITRIWAESEKKILAEDPFGGKIYVINSAGELIYELDLNFQPLILPSGETVRVEYSEDAAASREIMIKTYKIPAKLESASIKVSFHLPVQNFIALGADADNNLTAYAVLGAYNDAPSEAYFLSINSATGRIIDKTPAPISPEMSCMRYVRAAPGGGVEGGGGPFIFARSNEDEYLVTRHDFKR